MLADGAQPDVQAHRLFLPPLEGAKLDPQQFLTPKML
jgi:hypothetical protein